MGTARIADLTAEHARFLIEYVGPVCRASIDDDPEGTSVTVLMPPAGLLHLQKLTEESDGYLDESGQVWIGGAVAGRIAGYRSVTA